MAELSQTAGKPLVQIAQHLRPDPAGGPDGAEGQPGERRLRPSGRYSCRRFRVVRRHRQGSPRLQQGGAGGGCQQLEGLTSIHFHSSLRAPRSLPAPDVAGRQETPQSPEGTSLGNMPETCAGRMLRRVQRNTPGRRFSSSELRDLCTQLAPDARHEQRHGQPGAGAVRLASGTTDFRSASRAAARIPARYGSETAGAESVDHSP